MKLKRWKVLSPELPQPDGRFMNVLLDQNKFDFRHLVRVEAESIPWGALYEVEALYLSQDTQLRKGLEHGDEKKRKYKKLKKIRRTIEEKRDRQIERY